MIVNAEEDEDQHLEFERSPTSTLRFFDQKKNSDFSNHFHVARIDSCSENLDGTHKSAFAPHSEMQLSPKQPSIRWSTPMRS
jgi:hypothetical protein